MIQNDHSREGSRQFEGIVGIFALKRVVTTQLAVKFAMVGCILPADIELVVFSNIFVVCLIFLFRQMMAKMATLPRAQGVHLRATDTTLYRKRIPVAVFAPIQVCERFKFSFEIIAFAVLVEGDVPRHGFQREKKAGFHIRLVPDLTKARHHSGHQHAFGHAAKICSDMLLRPTRFECCQVTRVA